MNQQEHEYMHAHGIEHTHHTEADPRHTLEHDHSACAGSTGCDHNCSGCGSAANLDPKAEVIALIQYMVKHNTAHAAELAKMGKRFYELNEKMAGDQVMQAVADYEKGNMRLSTILAALNIPQGSR